MKKISQSIYIDLAYGADTEDLAYELYQESKSLLKEGGFNLWKFVMNSTTLQGKIDHHESQLQSQSNEKNGDLEDESYTKTTLGTIQQMDEGEQKILEVILMIVLYLT